jgi:hypothetical protein
MKMDTQLLIDKIKKVRESELNACVCSHICDCGNGERLAIELLLVSTSIEEARDKAFDLMSSVFCANRAHSLLSIPMAD